jgi:hypothetical protein
MKTIISLGNGTTLEIKDIGGSNNRGSVSVALKDVKGITIGGGWSSGEDFKRLGKVMK